MSTQKFKAKRTEPLQPGATERYLNYQQNQFGHNPLIQHWNGFKSRYLNRWILIVQSILFLCIGFATVYVLTLVFYNGPEYVRFNQWLQKSPLAAPIQRVKSLGEQLTQGSKDIVLRDNMERLRLMLETFPTGDKKVYPINLQQLQEDAQTDNYWNLHKNPLTGSHSVQGIIADYSAYTYSNQKENFAEMVLYESVSKSVYRIYGCDKTGKIIQKSGKDFYLSNL